MVDEKDIIELYNELKSTHEVGKRIHKSHMFVSDVLKKNNVDMFNVGKRVDIGEDVIDAMVTDYVANNLKMADIEEKYGVYSKKLRRIFRKRGIDINRWRNHEKKIVQKKEKPAKEKKATITCRYCGWETVDVECKSHAYAKHIINKHGKSISEYLSEYPEDKDRLGKYKDRSEMVQCAVCGKYRKIIDNRHMQKHGMNMMEYYMAYGDKKTVSELTREKLSMCLDRMYQNKDWERASSNAEREIFEYLTEHGVKCDRHDRTVLDGEEIDILCHEKRIGVEYDGLVWHTEWFGKKNHLYHYDKMVAANKNGYKLIHIFEDEYKTNKELVLNKLLHIFGCGGDKRHIMGRKCHVVEIPKNQASIFLTINHIQGYVNSTVTLGCMYGEELVGVMCFKEERQGKWNLTRFATDNRYVIQGCGGKMFKHFTSKYKPDTVFTFADRRWTVDKDNNLYTKIGFKLECETRPNYSYYYMKDNKTERFHKFGFRKQILAKKYGFPLTMTETEMVKELGYDRIWDCGLFKYVWKAEV